MGRTEGHVMQTQTAQILAHLKRGRAITPLEALDQYQCFRLGARIFELKAAGHDISKRMVETASGKKVAEYRLDG
jgi:hypothetical protein